MLETRCSGCQVKKEVPEKTIHLWIPSFVYFSVYYGTMWAFFEYISPKFRIIYLIQHENKWSYNSHLNVHFVKTIPSLNFQKLKKCKSNSVQIFFFQKIVMSLKKKGHTQIYSVSLRSTLIIKTNPNIKPGVFTALKRTLEFIYKCILKFLEMEVPVV